MNRKVVVTGMGLVTPLGNDRHETWKGLVSGRVAFAPQDICEDSRVSLIAPLTDFDPCLYMSRSDCLHTDPYVHYATAAASMAIEESGISGNADPERSCVFFGTGIGGGTNMFRQIVKYSQKGARCVSPFFIPKSIPNMAAAEIAIRNGFTGTATAPTAACSSGSMAIGEAIREIRHGYADIVIAGGSEAPLFDASLSGFAAMHALSPSNNPEEAMLPFDIRRAGFVMSEGAGALVLEEYEHAKKRGAEIIAEAAGFGSSCDAYGITAPEPSAAQIARAIRTAVSESGANTDRIYINAHGTATEMNDVVETIAIKKALGDTTAKAAQISSTKSMLGHSLGASGAIEAVIAIMALKKGIAPPTAGLKSPDPKCDLNYTPIEPVEGSFELALSNTMAFGGHNVCLAFR